MLLRDSAYDAIRLEILEGRLAPGERVRDHELAARLGFGRTPVREALGRLEEEGLVETRPRSYTRVTPLSRQDAREAFPIVAALHALAAELAELRPEDVERLREANLRFARAVEAQDVAAALEADDDFHAVFVDRSGNGELARQLERLQPRLRRLERLRFGSLAGRHSVEQHDRIIELTQEGGAAEAVRENWLTLGALIDRSFPEEETS